MEQLIKNFEKYLKNERKYPDNTVIGYLNYLNNYNNFIKENNINYKTITKDEIRDYLKSLFCFSLSLLASHPPSSEIHDIHQTILPL